MTLVNIVPHVIPHQKMHSIVSGNFLGGSKASPAACVASFLAEDNYTTTTPSNGLKTTTTCNESMFENPYSIVVEGTYNEIDPAFATAYESLALKIIAMMSYILKVPIGCTIWFLVLHFEQFGGDPQKRSVFNQIVAFLAAIEIIGVLTAEHLFMARVFFGCMPDVFGTIIWFCIACKSFIGSLFLMMASTYKMSRLYFFRRIAGLNDNFISIFILIASIINSLIYTTIQYMMGENERHPQYQSMTCGRGEIDFNQK